MKGNKWWMMVLMLLLLVTSAVPQASAAAKQISIYLDGTRLASDTAPYILAKSNVTMVPLRVISEGLGASAYWDQKSRTVNISGQQTDLTLTYGSKIAMANGKSVALDTAVDLKNGRVMVPIRFVSEQMGLQVLWNQSTYRIDLNSMSAGTPEVPGTTTPVPNLPANPGTVDSSTGVRGAWISTINGDWPSSGSTGKPAAQQQDYINTLDKLKAMGINAVYVQVRANSDTIYPSAYAPWGKFLTGTQGKDPGYDPLAFMIQETHKRGMQFHAWFNPFRASTTTSTAALASSHVAKAHPEWIVNAGNQLYINPGIPAARQYIIDSIMEVVKGYDIDGVHMDDYFYPSNAAFADSAAYAAYNTGRFSTLADWRRDNINQFVQQLGQAVHQVKPAVQYGISPFAVWRNKSVDPTGSDTKAGITTYDSMYADVRTWVKQGWIDYVMPQVYWSIGYAPADYAKVVAWWVQEVKGTKVQLYIGHAAYKVGAANEAANGWSKPTELISQLSLNGKYPEIGGDVFFSAQHLIKNPLGVSELIRLYYAYGLGFSS
ncbi:family 10 glycosylhydrolase [Paenibacillus sp. JX-17]|uniref:Family 10 glycosylhydrolase n=1 Tax=Paenibacillus lacisoli TaxID=3064525 RepID=A0ABT9C942_9BACL|nr:family 10 glycosylhydrolase [Paenibacillus sp. JX-17]MDO7905184.1 family 10 glycosylhydrolase [Paenibacillus sp. JX-17]